MPKKLKIGLLIFLLLLVWIIFTPEGYSARRTGLVVQDKGPVVMGNNITYYVKAGDSLYKISRKYGTTVRQLKLINGLWSNMIYVNQKLIIPVETNESYIIYNVRAGDSLYKISKKFGTSIQKIKTANNLQSNIIYIWQRLKVPTASTPEYGSINGKVGISNKTGRINSAQGKTVEPQDVLPLNTVNSSLEYESNEIIVKYRPVVTSQAQDNLEKKNNLVSLSSLKTEGGTIVHYRFPENRELAEMLDYYNELDNVDWAEPNYIYYPTAVPSDSYYNYYQWDYINLNLEAAWDLEKGDDSVTVAVLDTGVISNHPDLQANLLQGVDFVGGTKSYPVSSYTITDNDPTDETTRANGGSHGTHVAGIIGAITDNQRGIAGMNWQVNILPVRVLKKKGGSSWDIVEGIYYAIDQEADVINLSLGSRHKSLLQEEAVKQAASKGITVVAATGNESSSVYYPAAFRETIAVGAVGKDSSLTYYSNYGPEVDVVAPGGGSGESIQSTWGYYQQGKTISGYAGMIGTSMATPHVSGAVALLIANGVQGPENIRRRLTSTAIDLGQPGKDNYYGYGLVDVYGALLGKKLSSPEVFAGVKEGNVIKVKSEMKTVDHNGSFNLERVESGEVFVFGWRDTNENGVIDKGDYYGKTSETLYINGNSNYKIDLEINYVSNSMMWNGSGLYIKSY